MESRERFDAKEHFVGIAFAALTMAAVLVLPGCGKQLARIEENQIILQRLAGANAEQIAASMARIEKNQSRLQVVVEDVQVGTKKGVTDVAAVRQEQARLQETLKNNSQQLARNIAVVEQNQQGLKGGIEHVHSGVQKVANGTNALLQNMLELLEALQSNNQNLANTMNLVGQKQLKFEERILTNIQAIAGVVDAIEQQQAKMQGQIGDVQNNTQAMRKDMVAILERLGAELSEISAQISSTETPKDNSSPAEPKQ